MFKLVALFLCLFAVLRADYSEQLRLSLEVAEEAGQLILEMKNQDLGVEYKVGSNGIAIPVTNADRKANLLISQKLLGRYSDYGFVSQEENEDPALQEAFDRWTTAKYTWIIDPLDGTESYLKGGREFGVHICLTEDGQPVVGVIYFPALDTFYYAMKGGGAYKRVGHGTQQKIHVAPYGGTPLPVYSTPAPIITKIYEALKVDTTVPLKKIGSHGMRFCSIIEGSTIDHVPVNLYISSGFRGGIWDPAPGVVIIQEAGGQVSDLKGQPLNFRRARLETGLVVTSSKELHQQIISIAN